MLDWNASNYSNVWKLFIYEYINKDESRCPNSLNDKNLDKWKLSEWRIRIWSYNRSQKIISYLKQNRGCLRGVNG